MENENLDLKKTLEYIGFSEKEVAVYLALLELGVGTVTEISRKAGINRPTTYHILASLELKGLAKLTGKEPKEEYSAESPDQIEVLLEKKLEQEKEFIKEARRIIPELKSIHNISERPKILFYEGKEGLEKVYEDTLTSSGEIKAYANVDEMHKALPNYFPEYYKRRKNRGIFIRAILPSNKEGFARAQKDASEARESTLVPNDKYYFSPEINIYDNKVMIASWREKLGIIIESAEIADAMKKTFELAWLGAKEEEKTLN